MINMVNQGQSAAKAAVKNLIIYSITNVVNGKKYVGQTRQGLARRKGEHIHRFNLGERDHKLYKAMRKYGIENFKFEVLCHCRLPEYLNEMEQHFIARFNSFNRGYNMTCGGDGVSDETRAKLSTIFKGRRIHWYDKIVAARRARYGANMSSVSPKDFVPKGAKNANAKTYQIRFPDGSVQTIKGLRAFCKAADLDHSTLLATLSGLQRHHKGYSLLARFND